VPKEEVFAELASEDPFFVGLESHDPVRPRRVEDDCGADLSSAGFCTLGRGVATVSLSPTNAADRAMTAPE